MTAIISAIVTAILGWVAAKFHTYLVRRAALDAENVKVTAAATAQKAASTPEQIDEASKTVANNF